MKCRKRSFAVVTALFVVLLLLSRATRDADLVSPAFAASQTAKQQCISACRARYRDCRHLNKFPSFECQGVYQDCIQYRCTGLGPG